MHNKSINAVFIIGVGRSGTSLLQSILSTHSQLCIPQETGFLRNIVLSFKKYKSLTFKQATVLHPRLKRVAPGFLNKASISFADEIELYRNFLEGYRKQENKKVVGDKDPRLIEYINATSRLFPEARFIHMIRDPRDVLLSKKKATWSKGRSSLYHIFANYVQLELARSMGCQLKQGDYHTVIYERLLQHPESVISEICEFLGVGFEKAMLHFQEKAGELISEDELQWKKETTGPLLTDNFGKWKGKLADWEVALTELLCRQAFCLGSYEVSGAFSKLSYIKKGFIVLFALLMQVSGNIYILYRQLYQKAVLWWKL